MTTAEADRSASLPVRLQEHYRSYLYGALPLCVICGTGLEGWAHQRYIELFSVTVMRPQGSWIALDFVDAQTYGDVLSSRIVSADAARALPSMTEFAAEAMRDGWYVIAFLDVPHLHAKSDIYIHEVLLHGHDLSSDQFAVVGFDVTERFAGYRAERDLIEAAFWRGMAHMTETGDQSHIANPILLLRPRGEVRSPLLEDVSARWRRYASGAAPAVDEAGSLESWWLRPEQGPSFEKSLGLSVYDDLRLHFASIDGSAGAPLGAVHYRAVHVLAEHKRSLLKCVAYLRGLPELSDPLRTAHEALQALVRDVDPWRYRALLAKVDGRRTFPLAAFLEKLDVLRQRETEVVDRVVHALLEVPPGRRLPSLENCRTRA